MSNARFRRFRLFAIGALCATMIAPTLADTPPRLLDDNRGDDVLRAAESVAFNAAVLLLGFPANPFVSPYLPIDVKGRVLGHPKIHNIYLDDDWDAHNPDAPTSAQIDAFTRALASSHYLDAAAIASVVHTYWPLRDLERYELIVGLILTVRIWRAYALRTPGRPAPIRTMPAA